MLNATGGGILHGKAIAQTTFDRLQWPESRDVERVSAVLGAAWRHSVPGDAVTDRVAVSLSNPDALPLADWLDFGGDTATAEQMLAAAAESARRLGPLARAATR